MITGYLSMLRNKLGFSIMQIRPSERISFREILKTGGIRLAVRMGLDRITEWDGMTTG